MHNSTKEFRLCVCVRGERERESGYVKRYSPSNFKWYLRRSSRLLSLLLLIPLSNTCTVLYCIKQWIITYVLIPQLWGVLVYKKDLSSIIVIGVRIWTMISVRSVRTFFIDFSSGRENYQNVLFSMNEIMFEQTWH